MLAVFAFPALPTLELRERWSFPLETRSSAGEDDAAVVGARAYYVEAHWRRPKAFACLDLTTGRRVWRRAGPAAGGAFVVANDRHVLGSAEGEVLEFAASTGKTVWQARRDRYGVGPVLVGDRLFYEPHKGTLVAVDLKRRREVWRRTFSPEAKTGLSGAEALGDTLVLTTRGGSLIGVATVDGRLRWRRQTGQGKYLTLSAMGGAALVTGEGTAAYRARDGKELWRAKEHAGWHAAYFPRIGEAWTFGMDGRLARVSAATGRILSIEAPIESEGDALDVVKPYGDGFLLGTRGPLLRLDRRGKPKEAFEPRELIHKVYPLGSDVLLRTSSRFVRLTPGTIPAPKDLPGLLGKPILAPEEQRSVIKLGRGAVPALLAEAARTAGKRREALSELLAKTAGPEDSLAVLALAERWGLFNGAPSLALGNLLRWLDAKGDPNAVADALLPRFLSMDGDAERARYLPFLVRGTRGRVVDEMLALLRDPATPGNWKSAIYGSIGGSGREDVLDTIRAIRAGGRRLAKPIAGLSATKDSDGDGLPDAVDANPLVAPRAMGEREKAMAAAFDAFFRFGEMTDRVGLVRYGDGVKPFELLGWKGGVLPEETARLLKDDLGSRVPREERYAFLDFRTRGGAPPTVQGGPDGRTATVDLGALYGGKSGWGVRVTLRKFGDEWFSVDIREAWIS